MHSSQTCLFPTCTQTVEWWIRRTAETSSHILLLFLISGGIPSGRNDGKCLLSRIRSGYIDLNIMSGQELVWPFAMKIWLNFRSVNGNKALRARCHGKCFPAANVYQRREAWRGGEKRSWRLRPKLPHMLAAHRHGYIFKLTPMFVVLVSTL